MVYNIVLSDQACTFRTAYAPLRAVKDRYGIYEFIRDLFAPLHPVLIRKKEDICLSRGSFLCSHEEVNNNW